MNHSNNSTNAMQCIPHDCGPAIIAVKGSEEIEAEDQARHDEMVAIFNALLVETDSEESDPENEEIKKSVEDEFYGEETSNVRQHYSVLY